VLFRSSRFSEMPEEEVLERFLELHESDLENIVSNNIAYEDFGDCKTLSLEVLNTAFELIPLKTNDEAHKRFVTGILPVFSEKLLADDDDKVDYTLKHRFLEKLAYLVLNSKRAEIGTYLQPFVDNFDESEYTADLFQALVSAEDSLNQYKEFWTVWNIFYPKMVELCNTRGSYHYIKQIIHNYLLAWPYWREDAKEWHSLKDREKLFFRKVAQDMGHHPSVLYSLSKLLNEIGSKFLEDGILWISGLLQENENLFAEELEINTVYYLENIVRKYALMNRRKIKTSTQIKSQITNILNFLVERGSVTGYLLREDVL